MYTNYQSSPSYMEGGAAPVLENDYNVFSEKTIRMGFIRKVYGILSVQLLITLGSVTVFSASKEASAFAASNTWLVWVGFGVVLASLIPLACCGLHRSFPINMGLLGVFTIGEALVVGMSTSFRRGEIVLYAVLITAVIVLALTVFAFQTKIDFTVFNGLMFVFFMVFMLFGLIVMFIPKNNILMLIYSGIGALIFSVYLIIDTQMIVGGRHKHQFSAEDYVMGAITLYLDIINIFLYILSILDASK